MEITLKEREEMKYMGYKIKATYTNKNNIPFHKYFVNKVDFKKFNVAVLEAGGHMTGSYTLPVSYMLTENGKKIVNNYILELEAKRKEILDAKKDTADETTLPTLEDIVNDIQFCGVNEDDPDGPCYYNGWGVTDNYDADYPILLKRGRDFIEY